MCLQINPNKADSCDLRKRRSACMVKISLMQKKYHWWLYYYVHFLISEYLPHDRQSMLAHFNNKTVLFYTAVFLYTLESIHLKYLKSLQSVHKFELIISNDMWPHVFRYEVGSYIYSYYFVTYLSYILFLFVCGNFTLTLKKWRCWNLLISHLQQSEERCKCEIR